MDKNGYLYICDFKKDEVRRWKQGEKGKGTIVTGGNGKGNHLNQLNGPNYIFVDDDDSLYISEWYNHRVMKWTKNAKEVVVVAGGNGNGNSFRHLSRPAGVFVDHYRSVIHDKVLFFLRNAE
jgi:sugar lactone lactonase YvrE